MINEKIAKDFTEEYYKSDVWNLDRTTFMGITTFKAPTDLWMYQQLIWKVKPTLIIETGTAFGGSALYLNVILDCLARCGMSQGRIISIDIDDDDEKKLPASPAITFIKGVSSVFPPMVAKLAKEIILPKDKVMVVLDSDHTEEHVLREMELYAPFVSVNSYMIVEDTNITIGDTGRGPANAVTSFMKKHGDEFVVDKECEKFGLTFNPGGYLRRVK